MSVNEILALNVGSSSLKFALYGASGELPLNISGGVERIGKPATILKIEREGKTTEEPIQAKYIADALPAIAKAIGGTRLAGIAHRIVHGGSEFTNHQKITPQLIDGLRKITALAPNHLPPEIDLIEAAQKQFPDVPHFACFDTVFHRDMPAVARLLPLPRKLGVRRYGFHGLSFSYIMGQLPEYIGDKANRRVILAHLGSGCSLAAVRGGKSIDTTMGMTPLGGLPMATRSGDLDPGIAGYLNKTQGMTLEAFEHIAYAESGLLGVSETSGDIRDLLASEGSDPRAAEAVQLFCYQARRWIAAMAAAAEGVDVLVFTGGIGANSPIIRQRICDDLDWMGITLDMGANAHGEQCISAPQSKVLVFAMATNEEYFMAETTLRLLGMA